MRVLIYEPLPDMNRAPIIAQLARTLMDDGHEVLVVLEEKLIYTLLGKLTHQGVINCSRTWRRHMGIHRGISVYKLKTPPGQYWFVGSENLRERLEQIATLRRTQYEQILGSFAPEKIFIWNGQHEHLQDFMELAKKTHEGKFIYMECGWFPQKGTIYFDTEGVNAASSIALLPPQSITDIERQQLQEWKSSYAGQVLPKKKLLNIFVPLQVDTDTNITLHSPFETMQEFIDFLENWIPNDIPTTIRPHPLSPALQLPKIKRGTFKIDTGTPLNTLIDDASLVIGINSTVLLESLIRNTPVICFGQGFLQPTPKDSTFHNAVINTYENNVPLLHLLAIVRQDKIDSCRKAVEILEKNRIQHTKETSTSKH